MKLSVAIGVLSSIVSFSNLVVGDPLSVLTVTKYEVKNNPNDYFDNVDIEIVKGKKSSIMNAKIPVKKELPPTMEMKSNIVMTDGTPIERSTLVCDALTDPGVGSTFVRAGQPKDTFPKDCPFIAGDWSILKWDPPVERIPPGIPDGIMSGSIIIGEDGKDPCFQVDFEAQLTHDVPGLGR